MSFQEYPRVMKHPRSRPAVVYKQPRYRPGEEGYGVPIDPGQTGKPAQFPDVMVNNLDQEQEYAAKGYVPTGKSDPEAYRRSMTGNESIPESKFQEYPKVLYKATRNADDPESEPALANKTVASSADEAAATGWYASPSEAIAALAKPKITEKPKEKTAVKPKAKAEQTPRQRADAIKAMPDDEREAFLAEGKIDQATLALLISDAVGKSHTVKPSETKTAKKKTEAPSKQGTCKDPAAEAARRDKIRQALKRRAAERREQAAA